MIASLHVAATVFMTGVIWFVQVVHYPLFSRVGAAESAAYAAAHQRSTTWVVLPPMVVEALTGLWLAIQPPQAASAVPLRFGFGLIVVIWCATFFAQVPAHARLAGGFEVDTHARLVRSNWIRTAAWSARSALVLTWLT